MTVAQPLIELDASYARAVPRLSVPWTAAPAPAPELLVLNDGAGRRAGPRRRRAAGARGGGAAGRPRAAGGGRDGRAGLRGPPVRLLPAPPRRRPGAAARRGRRPRGPPARPAPEGLRAHAVRPRRRRQGRGGPDAARVPHRRGDARARHPDHAGAGRRRHRRAGAARAARCPARCSAGSPRATCGWARSSTPPPPATADVLRALADYAIARHHPDAADAENPYLELYRRVVDAQAELVARWMLVGFIHGVMNTDNMTISGETIDYGPCAFMDAFDPATVFSSIDHGGRYAYGNQAADRPVEPRAPRRGAAAPDRRGHRRRGGRRRRGGQRVRRRLPSGTGTRAWPPSSACPRPTRSWPTDLPALLRAQHVDFTSFFRALSAGTARDLFLDRDAVRRVGRPPRRAAARRPGGGGGGHGPGQPRLHPAQPPRRGGAHRGHRGRPGAVPHGCSTWSRGRSRRGPGWRTTPGRPATAPRTSPTAAPDVSPAPGA